MPGYLQGAHTSGGGMVLGSSHGILPITLSISVQLEKLNLRWNPPFKGNTLELRFFAEFFYGVMLPKKEASVQVTS